MFSKVFRAELGAYSITFRLGRRYRERADFLIAPIIYDLEKDGVASFHFANGHIECPPPAGTVLPFPPPYYRFWKSVLPPSEREGDLKSTPTASQWADWLDAQPGGGSARDKAVSMNRKGFPAHAQPGVDRALAHLHQLMEEHGPFDGLLGRCEGGSAAAALLLEHSEKYRAGQAANPFRCAVFFNAIPPPALDGSRLLLADGQGPLITIPTCHISSALGPLQHLCLELEDLCDPSSRTTVYHDEGYNIPTRPVNTARVSKVLREFVQTVERA